MPSSSDSSSSLSHSPSVTDRKRKEPDSSAHDPPVLSHAERRRQRKRARLALKEGSDPASERASKKRQGITDKTAHNKARQNSVWVGNLSFKTTLDDLNAFFNGAGEITRVHMPVKPGSTTDNRGFVCTYRYHLAYIMSTSLLDSPMWILLPQKPKRWQSHCLKTLSLAGHFSSKRVMAFFISFYFCLLTRLFRRRFHWPTLKSQWCRCRGLGSIQRPVEICTKNPKHTKTTPVTYALLGKSGI
jgi:hypothetical protein